MGKAKQKCLKPKKDVEDPSKCSKEQIRKCHGNVKKHPCVSK